MSTNVYEYLGNDFTNIYKLEEHNQRYTDAWEIRRAMESGVKGVYFFFHRCLSFGDYDSSCEVERSNVRVFLEEFKSLAGVEHITGCYGYEGIGIDITCTDERIIDCLSRLDNYCVMNDEDCSQMKLEMEDEAWNSFISQDFKTAIEKKFGAWHREPDEEKLRAFYDKLKEMSNTDAVVECGGNVYIDIDRMLQYLTDTLSVLKLKYIDAA